MHLGFSPLETTLRAVTATDKPANPGPAVTDDPVMAQHRVLPDMRQEARHVNVTTTPGPALPVALCGLCSALVAIDDEGELRHALFHDATDTIPPTPTRPPSSPPSPSSEGATT
jgi:hypothetical protein